jgi:HK97 family phage prohead protease
MESRFTRLIDNASPLAQNAAADTFRAVFSTPEVGRDGHVVITSGIQHAHWDNDPVIMFAHDVSEPPIGRGLNIDTSGRRALVDIQFAPADLNPFAETVRGLVAAGFLRAVSMSWQPLEWQYSQDRTRPGGVDFSKVDLLEISVVPVPALPSALFTARSRGIDTGPLARWAERRLDKGEAAWGMARSDLEVLYRAARASGASSDSVADRLRRLREIQERGERLRRIDEINERGRRIDRLLMRLGRP